MTIVDFFKKIKEKFDQPSADDICFKDALSQAVDLVVKSSHPNIYYVPHYQKRLTPAVEHTIKFINEIIAQIPSPILIEENSWTTNPFIRTVFVDNSHFKKFFLENRVLEEFFQKTGEKQCIALLVMKYSSKTIFGAEIDGDIIKKNVLRTSVDFSDHQIVFPKSSEEQITKEMLMYTLRLIAAHALKDICALIESKKELETEKQTLEIKIELQNSHASNKLSDQEQLQVSQLLEQIDHKLCEVKKEINKPENYLNKVINLLYHPEQFIKSEPVRLFVDKMNMIEDIEDKNDEIRFLKIITSEGMSTAVAMVNYKKLW